MNRPASLAEALMRLEEREALSAIAQRITSVGTFIYNIAEERSTWSPELRRMVGIAEGEEALSFDQILEMAHPDDRERIRSSLDHVKVIGDRIDVEHRLYRTDGELLHMHVRGEIMEFAGQSSPCIVGTVQDITERKRAEEMIAAQAARLGEMQAEVTFLSGQSAMGTMAATLAHELNQPLTAIANYASGLRRTELNAANASLIQEGLAAIQENAIRAGEIIRRMRAMAKQREVRKERLLFDQVVRDSTRLSGLGCDNVTILCDLKDGAEVLADKIQIQQVLVNLIRNACEAVCDSATKEIEISTRDGSGVVQVCVSDTGPGIPPELLPSVFEANVSTKEHGMGIGLSISRTIIEAHGGQIWAENGERGARFCFTLPIASG